MKPLDTDADQRVGLWNPDAAFHPQQLLGAEHDWSTVKQPGTRFAAGNCRSAQPLLESDSGFLARHSEQRSNK